MMRERVARILLAASFQILLGCSSDDTIVSARVQSSNDNKDNSATEKGRKGGLLVPGIPDGILHPGSPTPDVIRTAKTVRITVSQDGQSPVSAEVVPPKNAWTVDKLDENGMPVLDGEGKKVQEERASIGSFFTRLKLRDSWKGDSEAMAEALDEDGNVLLSASVEFKAVENEVVYVPIDLKLPEPPPEPQGGEGGTPNEPGGAGGAGGTGEPGGSGGTAAGSGGSPEGGGAGGAGGDASLGGNGGTEDAGGTAGQGGT
jgi:hypothetical protein